MGRIHIASLALLACSALASRADVRDTAAERALSLPAGGPALVFQRADWVISKEQRRPNDSAVYYMLTSDAGKLALSAYIDKSSVCNSAASCLQEALKNPSYRDAKDQRLSDVGVFKAAEFYLDQPAGVPLKQAHILASAYIDGHWLDIHISKSGPTRPDMAPLTELLKSLRVH